METTSNTNRNGYATQPLKVGDRVGCRVSSDIKPGTIIKASASRATVRLHNFELVNKPGSGHPEAMTVSVGGFAAHWEGRQINKIDFDSDAGTCQLSFRKGDQVNDVTGVWRQVGFKGGRGKLPGIVYLGEVAHYDYNF